MKIAIIGGGISGNAITYLLHQHHDVTLYEANDYIGGHSRTIDVKTPDGLIPVDTGFIVFNERNYPHLCGLFKHLDVPTQKSTMSFGVSVNNGWLEYGTPRPQNIFAQKENILRLSFLRLIKDILKFNNKAERHLDAKEDITLEELLTQMKMSEWFKQYYLLAMGASIWSTPVNVMLEFPAKTFIQFFKNHGLLTIFDQPQWHTVQDGSREYVSRITEPFKDKIKLNCPIKSVKRDSDKVQVEDAHGNIEHYDQVIFACHSDQALNILSNPTPDEQSILGAIRYQPNKMILHTDTSFMPKRKNAWTSWVYLSEQQQDNSNSVSLSYWMNNLQPLETQTPIIVTLNPGRSPDPKQIKDEYTFEHPVFDQAAINAQQELHKIQGKDKIWYCGAWQRYGFHEDGILSAVNVAKEFGITPPWT